jgi:hypothetical protein
MSKFACIFFSLFFHIAIYSQNTFQKSYGGSWAENSECIYEVETIKQTSDNGYAICSTTQTYAGPSNSGAYFLKLNANGDTSFVRTFYRENPTRGRSVHQTIDGGYILGVDYSSINGGLIKLDNFGNIQWSKDIIQGNLSSTYHATPLKDGGYLLSGGGWYGTLSKVDVNGNLVFGKRYKTPQNNNVVLFSSLECSNGDIISVGYYYNSYTYALVMRLDSTGNIKFSKIYNISNNVSESFKSVELSDKSIVICGYVGYANYNRDILLIKMDSLGNTIDVKTIGDSYSQRTTNIIKDKNENLFIAGQANNLFSNDAGLLLKISPIGNIVFSKTYLNGAMCEGIDLTSDNGIVMEGMTSYFGNGNTDRYVFKTDSNGYAGCNTIDNPLPINTISNYSVSNLSLLNSSNQFTVQNTTYSVSYGTQISTKCQNIIGISEEKNNDYEISLFPNPNNGFLSIENKNIRERIKISIYNNLGQNVFNKTIQNGENIFDINYLLPGIYTYTIQEDNIQKKTGKIIKQ